MSGGGFGGVPYGGGPYGGGSSVPAFSNLGFEIPGARAGFAAGWTVTQQSSAFEIGGYFSAQNLVLWSEALDHAPWVPIGASINAGAARAWDDDAPADAIVDTAVFYAHGVMQATLATSGSLTFSVEVKSGAVDQVFLQHGELGAATFDLTNGTVVGTSGGATASIDPLGIDGWYRCAINITAVSDGRFAILAATGGLPVYTGTGTAALYLARTSIRTGAAIVEGVGYTQTTDTPVDLTLPYDGFERLWSNEGYRVAFGTGAAAIGLYDTANTPKPREDFETGWSPPGPYRFALDGQTVAALFHRGDVGEPIPFEEFEGGWMAGVYSEVFEPGDTEAGLYNVYLFVSSPVETFELESSWWPTGPLTAYLTDFSLPIVGESDTLAAGQYATGNGTTQAFEDFESVFPEASHHGPIIVTVNPGTDVVYTGLTGGVLSVNTPILLSSTDTLPAPFQPATTYWPVSVGIDGAGSCKLAAAHGGSPINITDSGTGTHTAVGDPKYLWQDPIERWT